MAQKSLKKNAFYNFARSFLNLVFPIISFPYASRILLPAGIGKVNFANSTIDYFVLIAGLGISTYAATEGARVRDNKQALDKLAREVTLINLISTVVAYILLACALFWVDKFNAYRMLLIVCSTKILFTTIGFEWLYTAEEEYRYITIRSFVFQVISMIFLFVFVKGPDDYLWYAGMGVLSNVGSNICNLFYIRKFINLFEKTKLEIKKHLKPIFLFFGMGCATKVQSALDAVMLGFMMGDTSVGYYSAAHKIKTMVAQLITAIIGTLMPRSSWYLEHKDMDAYDDIVGKAANIALFFSIPATFGVIAISKPLILIFSGEAYLPAVYAMRVLSPSIITISFTSFINNVILTPNRLERFTLQAEVIGSVLNITLNALLIPRWDYFGASVATMIAEFTIMLFMVAHARKFLSGKHIVKAFLQPLFGASAMLLVVLLVIKTIKNNFMQLCAGITTGVIVYAACMLLVRNQTALSVWQTLKKIH